MCSHLGGMDARLRIGFRDDVVVVVGCDAAVVRRESGGNDIKVSQSIRQSGHENYLIRVSVVFTMAVCE